MKHKYAKISLILVAIPIMACFLLPVTAHAADIGEIMKNGLSIIQPELHMSDTDPRVIVSRLIRTALGFLGILTLVMFLYGGLLVLTSGGDEEKLSRAKKTMLNTVLGLLVILMANSIVNFAVNTIVKATTGNDLGI